MKKPVSIGDTYGTWKVIGKSTEDKPYNYDYICQCECGEIKTYSKYALMNHKYGLCECMKPKPKSNVVALKNLKKDVDKGIVEIVNEKKFGNSIRYVLKCKHEHKFTTNGENYKGCSKCKQIKSRRLTMIKTALSGDNFKNTQPYCSQFWDYKKNELKPEEVLPSSKEKFWFICEEGHEFELSPAMIKYRGAWCSKCTSSHDSRLATYGKQLFKKIFFDVKQEEEFPINVIVDGVETILYPDLVIEDLKLNIEFHGSQHYAFTSNFHKDKNDFIKSIERDRVKKEWFLKNGYQQKVFKVTKDLDVDIKEIEEYIYNILLK